MSLPPGKEKRFFVSLSIGNLVLRHGPMTGPEAGEAIAEGLKRNINVVLVAECGEAIDWDELSLLDVCRMTPDEEAALDSRNAAWQKFLEQEKSTELKP